MQDLIKLQAWDSAAPTGEELREMFAQLEALADRERLAEEATTHAPDTCPMHGDWWGPCLTCEAEDLAAYAHHLADLSACTPTGLYVRPIQRK